MQNVTGLRNTANKQPLIDTFGNVIKYPGATELLSLAEIRDVIETIDPLSNEEIDELRAFDRRKKFSAERLISKCIEAFQVMGASVSRSQLAHLSREGMHFIVWDVFERDAKGILAGA